MMPLDRRVKKDQRTGAHGVAPAEPHGCSRGTPPTGQGVLPEGLSGWSIGSILA